MIEFSWRGSEICTQILDKTELNKSKYLYDPYKLVRMQMAAQIFLSFRNLRIPKRIDNQDKGFQIKEQNTSLGNYITAFLNRIEKIQIEKINESDAKSGKQSSEKKKNEIDSRNLIVTFLYTVQSHINFGDTIYYSDFIIKSLPHLFRAQRDEDEDTSKNAAETLYMVSWMMFEINEIDNIFEIISSCKSSKSWGARRSIAQFLHIFIPRHALLMVNEQVKRFTSLIFDMLSDTKLEVRQDASKALVSILMSSENENEIKRLIKRCMKLAKTKLIKVQKNLAEKNQVEDASKSLVIRHAGVLGLSSVVRAYPYSLPEWLPNILSFLSDYTYDPLPIGPALKEIFNRFKQTHQDSWHEFREKFSDEELSRLNDVTGTHHYFA